jgi:hypothetical protein
MMTFMQEGSKANTAHITALTADAAAALISSSSFEEYAGFDEVEADRLGVKLGQIVSIAPDDTGEIFLSPSFLFFIYRSSTKLKGKNHFTSGKLLGLSWEELIIEVRGSSGSPLRCHFPRLNYVVEGHKAKL